jgi:putative DNA primase/helicase
VQLGWRERKPPHSDGTPPPGGEEPPPPSEPEGPPPDRTIWVYGGLRHVAALEGVAAMHAARVRFYRRDWQLIEIAPKPVLHSDGRTIAMLDMVPIEEPILGMALATSATWVRVNAKGNVIRIDPDPVVPLVAKLHVHWRFPPLHGIARAPSLRPDGSLLADPGYDLQTGLYLALDDGFVMPRVAARPSRETALTALDLLRDLLSGFPFVDEASLAVALSLLITPVVRPAMAVAPLHLVTAPTPGTGKSYLVDVASAIATGDIPAVIAMPPREEELEKRLTGAALSGGAMIVLDNVRRAVESDFLCQLSERKTLHLRPLGTSQTIKLNNTFTTVLNGNNLAVADDLVRRSVRCALDANMARPERRQFAFDPLARVQAERGRYIAAALTIVRAYLAAGSPGKCPAHGSFGDWSDRVRSALVWLGCADPVGTITELRDDDPEYQALGLVFSAWRAAPALAFDDRGVTTADLIGLAEGHPALWEALCTVAPGRGVETGKPDRVRLGNWLRRRVNRIADGVKLMVNRSDRHRPRWQLVPIEEAGPEIRGFGDPD